MGNIKTDIKNSALSVAITSAWAALDDDSILAEEQGKKVLDEISAAHKANKFVAAGAEAAMTDVVRHYHEVAYGLRLNDDARALRMENAKLRQRFLELSRPAPVLAPPRSLPEATERYRGLVMRGWTTLEVEMLCVEIIRSQEDVVSFDSTGATTAKRRITRQWLREMNSPRDEPFKTKFLNNFPPLPSGEGPEPDAAA